MHKQLASGGHVCEVVMGEQDMLLSSSKINPHSIHAMQCDRALVSDAVHSVHYMNKSKCIHICVPPQANGKDNSCVVPQLCCATSV